MPEDALVRCLLQVLAALRSCEVPQPTTYKAVQITKAAEIVDFLLDQALKINTPTRKGRAK